MSNFKKGDRVKINYPELLGTQYKDYHGQIVTLTYNVNNSNMWNCKENGYYWQDKNLELVNVKVKLTYKEFMKSFKEEE